MPEPTAAVTAAPITTSITEAVTSSTATTTEAVTSTATTTTETVSSPTPLTVKQEPEEAEPEQQPTLPVVTPMETEESQPTESPKSPTPQQVIPDAVIKTEPTDVSDVEMKESSSAESDKPDVVLTPEVEPTPETEVKTEEDDKENDTTNLEKSLDGSGVTDTAPNFVAPNKLTAASIRINLTSQIDQDKTLERRESVVSNSSDADSSVVASEETSEMDPEAFVQPPKFADAETKPKLVGRKFVEMPPQMKGVDTSGLCSIM